MPCLNKIPQFPAGFLGTRVSGRGNRKIAGNLQGNPGSSCILSGFQGVSGYQREAYQENPGFFLHLIRVSGRYKFPNRRTGDKPRSYQRSRGKSNSQQESREKRISSEFVEEKAQQENMEKFRY